VEHQVRIGDLLVRPHEPTGLEVVRRSGTAPKDEPPKTNPRALPFLQRRLHGYGLRARVLDVDLKVILQVLADAGKIMDDVHAERAQLVCVADARKLQELR